MITPGTENQTYFSWISIVKKYKKNLKDPPPFFFCCRASLPPTFQKTTMLHACINTIHTQYWLKVISKSISKFKKYLIRRNCTESKSIKNKTERTLHTCMSMENPRGTFYPIQLIPHSMYNTPLVLGMLYILVR